MSEFEPIHGWPGPWRVQENGCVLVSLVESVMVVTLNRPSRLNAVNADLYGDLLSVLRAAESDAAVRVIVIQGMGRSFCSGADIKDHKSSTPSSTGREGYIAIGQHALSSLRLLSKPTVARVHGHAIGAGAEMALAADVVVSERSASWRLPELHLASYFGGGVTHSLPALAGKARAQAIMLLGETFSGREAAEWGLIWRSCESSALDAEVARTAQLLAKADPLGVRALKQQLCGQPGAGYLAACSHEAYALAEIMGSDAWRAGLDQAKPARVVPGDAPTTPPS